MNSHRDDSTPRTRELGAALRRHRIAAGLQSQQIARRLHCTAGQITHVEKGERNLDDFDLATFLGLCDVSREDMDAMAALAHEPDGRRVQGHEGHLPDELRTLIFLEANARVVENYEPMVVPGLAQTEEYARALFNISQRLRTPDLIDAHVRARLRRQRMLDRDNPPRLHLLVHEHALRAMVGGPRTMYEQMIALLLLTAHPRYSINVIMADAGPFGAFRDSFMLLRYEKHAPVAAVENRTASLFLDQPDDLVDYEFVVEELVKMSLTEDDSRAFLDELSRRYGDMM